MRNKIKKLIFARGLPGSGKSTVATRDLNKLQDILNQVRNLINGKTK